MATLDPALFRNFEAAGNSLLSNKVGAYAISNVTDPYGQDTSKIFSSVWPTVTSTELLMLFLSYVLIFIARNTRVHDVADGLVSYKDKTGPRNQSMWAYGWVNYRGASAFRAACVLFVHLFLPFAAYSMFILFSPQFAEVFQFVVNRGSLGVDLAGMVYCTVIFYILYIVVSAESIKSSKQDSARWYAILVFGILRLALAAAIFVCTLVSFINIKDNAGYPGEWPAVLRTLQIGAAFSGIATGFELLSLIVDAVILYNKVNPSSSK